MSVIFKEKRRPNNLQNLCFVKFVLYCKMKKNKKNCQTVSLEDGFFLNNQNKIHKVYVYYLLTFLHTGIFYWGAEAAYVSLLNKLINWTAWIAWIAWICMNYCYKKNFAWIVYPKRAALQWPILWVCVRAIKFTNKY